MSRVSSIFMSTEAVRQKGPQLDLNIQIGEDVTLWAFRGEQDPEPVGLDGVLVGVHIDVDFVTFDVAFEIHNTGVWMVTRNVSGRITKRGVNYNGEAITLTVQGGPPTEEPPPVRKPRLSVISNKDSELRDQEAAAATAEPTERAALQVVGAHPSDEPVTIEYPFRRDVFVEMTAQMPQGSLLVFEGQFAFQIEYPNRDVALAETTRFEQTDFERLNAAKAWKEVPKT